MCPNLAEGAQSTTFKAIGNDSARAETDMHSCHAGGPFKKLPR